MNTTETKPLQSNATLVGASIRRVTGCQLQVRRKVSPPDTYLDCSKMQIAFNEFSFGTKGGPLTWSASAVFPATNFIASAKVSDLST